MTLPPGVLETITCDPPEFIANRTVLGLDTIGLHVRGEPDWGDSEHELFMIRQSLGEIPADRHPPNREVDIQLMVNSEPGVTMPEAAAKLQKKVGTWQRETGFVRRDFDPSAGFASSVATQVYGASLGGLDGWLMAHRKTIPDVTLKLITGPYVYGTKEVESAQFKAEAAAYLKWQIETIQGSAPGLIRVTVKNEDAFDWKGLLEEMESRFLAPSATRTTTGDVVYECEALTLAGTSSIVAKAESSSGNVVENATLGASYVQILSSKVAGVGHMTHTGPRRMWFRVFDPGSTVENVELQLQWRALGSSRWSENRGVRVSVLGDFAKIDLGEARPETAVLGEQRWEWRVVARSRNGVTSAIRLDTVFVLSTEQWLALSTPPITLTPDTVVTKNPETATNEGILGKPLWTNPNNAKVSDNAYATVNLEGGGISQDLKVTNFGFALPVGAVVTGVVASIEHKSSVLVYPFEGCFDWILKLVKAGVKGGANRAALEQFWPTTDTVRQYGSSSDLWESSLTAADVNNTEFGISLTVKGTIGGAPVASVDVITLTVYYTESRDENRVCFGSRSIECRSDGAYRQHPTDEVWGRGTVDGFLPYAPPSGLEGRPVRGIIIPSRGDHLTQADTGLHKLSAVVRYFPGYHYTSEAR